MSPSSAPLPSEVQDQLFRTARTYSYWQDKPVPSDLLYQLYDLAKMGPTSANCFPLRVIFVQTAEGKEKLKPALAPANTEKTMTAPITAILAYDMEFYEHLPTLFPHADAKSWFTGNEALIEKTAVLNGSLQAAYFILAARTLGLDCGPMSGFDNAMVDQLFFKDTRFRSNILCNLGYGVVEKLHPRLPRPPFSNICSIV
jgi:3-hydroxypropanoate dehydrogenase